MKTTLFERAGSGALLAVGLISALVFLAPRASAQGAPPPEQALAELR